MLLRTRLRGTEKDPRLVAVLAALVWVGVEGNVYDGLLRHGEGRWYCVW